jgi:glycosyltransferase involved in cell wall biosynthesis
MNKVIKTKILFFLPNLKSGGAERVVINILRRLDMKKFEACLILVSNKGELFEFLPSNVEIVDLNYEKTLFSILKLRKVIFQKNPDIIFSTLIRTHIAIDLALTGIKNKPKLIFRSPNSPKLLLSNKKLSLLMRIWLEKSYKNANIVIAQTPEMKDEIVHYHSIESNKIVVLMNPLDTELIDRMIVNIKNPFNPKNINVVASGRLAKQKGYDILIRAFKYVYKKNQNFRLHIIGGDNVNEKKKYLQLVDDLNLNNNVIFHGLQKNPYRFYYFSDLFVLSSRWEGLPNTILENMYLKKPIVATKCIPFMNILIQNGVNGILVDIEQDQELANAILNYKEIDSSIFSQVIFNNDINIFLSGLTISNKI